MSQELNEKVIVGVFGKESKGDTLEERAKTSNTMWIRGRDHLGLYHDYHKDYKERLFKMTSAEVLEIFGFEKMLEALDRGSAIIVCCHEEPAASLIRVRKRLSLTQNEVAQKSGLKLSDVQEAEDENNETPFWTLFAICKVLDIDVRRITWEKFY